MRWKPSDRMIQAGLGVLLMLLSASYLWKDTIRPILAAKFDLEHLSETLKLGVRYWSWKDRAEDARRRAIEADLERMRSEQEKAGRDEQREESK